MAESIPPVRDWAQEQIDTQELREATGQLGCFIAWKANMPALKAHLLAAEILENGLRSGVIPAARAARLLKEAEGPATFIVPQAPEQPRPRPTRDEMRELYREVVATDRMSDQPLYVRFVLEALERWGHMEVGAPQWVVNNLAELGVKIRDRFFFLYKGRSLEYKAEDAADMHWRPVGKREFGETCHPLNDKDPTRYGTVDLRDSDEWKPLPLSEG